MRHERSNEPEHMLSGSHGDFTGVGDVQHMLFCSLFCSGQARSDSEAVLSVGLFVLHIAERPYRNCPDGAAEKAF